MFARVAFLSHLATLAACSGACLHSPTLPTVLQVQHATGSTVQLLATCFDGRSWYGSGVAVSTRHVLTAGHLAQACGAAGPFKVTAHVHDGRPFDDIELVVVRALCANHCSDASDGVDAALLVVTGVGEPFTEWARVGSDPPPGSLACIASFDPFATYSFRCGYVTGYRPQDGAMAVSFEVVPGNSGAPVLVGGEVVGILVAGTPTHLAGVQRIGYVEPISRWRSLLREVN